MKRLIFSALLAPLLGGPWSCAAEFEVLDRFTVDGYTVFRGSADIPGGSFSVGGSTFAVLNGKVGIGTTGPQSLLNVYGSAGNEVRIFSGGFMDIYRSGYMLRVDPSVTGIPAISQSGGTGLALGGSLNSNHLYVKSDGNVGIGTTAPAAILHIGGTGAVIIPAGDTGQRPAVGVSGMLRLNTTTGKIEYYNNGWYSVGATVASGGNSVNDVGGYRIHTFTGDGTFTVNIPGNVEVLVVAGGGGGGDRFGGGGGAGGLLYNSNYAVTAGNYSVVVGGGGAGGQTNDSRGSNGGNSSFSTLIASGGGGGASETTQPQNGGSGGGDSYNGAYTAGGTGISGQGNAGGVGIASPRVSGGGGGAGGAGVGGSNTRPDGGAGLSYSISGAAAYYAGGGGGSDNRVDAAGYGGPTSGNGGIGGGGQGGGGEGQGQSENRSGNGVSGTANTGGGGGGGSYIPTAASGRPGGSGGSGIVIIRYPI